MKTKKPINLFGVYLILAVTIACALGSLGLYIYRKNGSYALDLSRPDYQKTHGEIKYNNNDNDRSQLSPNGKIDRKMIEEFDKSFERYLKQLGEEIFTERSMSDEALGINKAE